MSASAINLPEPDVWEPAHLQLIAFPTSPACDVEQTWWQDITGDRPEESARKRQERMDQGVFQGSSLALSADVLRFVWIVAPVATPTALLENPIPTLGPCRQAFESFELIMRRWLDMSLPKIKRIAFAVKLTQPAKDRETGYRVLAQYLHDFRLDPDSTDFQYRINRKRPSRTGIPGLLINRLMTWGVLKVAIQARMGIPGSGEEMAASPVEAHFCSLDLDVNTIHEFSGEIPHAALGAVFSELVQLAIEIAKDGDIK
jgi:hypothetical protein